MDYLTEKHREALEIFISRYKKDKNVIGIVLSGSFVHSKPDKNSDLDLFIVTKNGKTRERGNVFINGIEIEYFINPVKQIKEYFLNENKKNHPSTAHMLVNSMIFLDRDKKFRDLLIEAKKILMKIPNKLDRDDIEFMKYFIDDLQKDLEDVYIRKDWFAFNFIAKEIIDKAIDNILATKRLRKEKNKRLENQIKEIDIEFGNLLKLTVLEVDYTKRFSYLNNLIDYVEKNLGGKRTKEWKLVTRCSFLDKK